MDPEFLATDAEHEHDLSVSSTSCKFEGALNVNKLQRWIQELIQTKATDLFRYKGVLAVEGMEKKFVFQGVHMLFSGGFSNEVAPWKEEKNVNVVLFLSAVTWTTRLLKNGFMDCKAEPLRFKEGDIVFANVGEYTEGKILKCWDDGNPYRVELQNEDKTNVWVPIDNDDYCRDSKP